MYISITFLLFIVNLLLYISAIYKMYELLLDDFIHHHLSDHLQKNCIHIIHFI